jgi:5'-nucleotidase
MAVSLASRNPVHFATAARIARELVERQQRLPLPSTTLLNVNVPDCPYEQLRGIRVTRLGRRHKSAPVIKSSNPRGETIWWVGAIGPVADAGEGTDFHAVEHGFVSVTPLSIDLTSYPKLETVSAWLSV